MANPAECGLRPFDHRMNRPEPKAWWAATLTAEKRAHVCQDGIRHVEYRLKWSESKYGDGETPGEPFGVGQIPQNLRNGFSSELPSWVKLEVWKRDQGRCQKCGTSSGLHFDHIIPLFEGWVVERSCEYPDIVWATQSRQTRQHRMMPDVRRPGKRSAYSYERAGKARLSRTSRCRMAQPSERFAGIEQSILPCDCERRRLTEYP
jgi:hypothetical protein